MIFKTRTVKGYALNARFFGTLSNNLTNFGRCISVAGSVSTQIFLHCTGRSQYLVACRRDYLRINMTRGTMYAKTNFAQLADLQTSALGPA
ncbi:hypothetical protein ADG881_2291 [Alcanivorax sp. DG881]|nr:hypothetical protein ADG881_2291 [Alcanivorax sp. DG881]